MGQSVVESVACDSGVDLEQHFAALQLREVRHTVEFSGQDQRGSRAARGRRLPVGQPEGPSDWGDHRQARRLGGFPEEKCTEMQRK